ncbi:hypothetical protein GCM10022216_32070 [Sphingobacterium kyonggiense]|uniref:Sugar 3,4-ketoisomerase QdtA cupin domain-containing protein n=1 Tax=Sphingobacterium kyonggiense TaxID=714075 RepID=A0ABP7Z3U1_9SPHI
MEIIKGGEFQDERGFIRFVNDFDMTSIRRFYILSNSSEKILRGWRGHRTENRWFFSIRGNYKIDVVKIDNWESPSENLEVCSYFLHERDNKVLNIPEGYATLIQSLTSSNELLIFADFNIEHAKEDDYVYDVHHFINRI